MIFVKKFTLPDFQAKIFTPQKCVICNIVHARYKSVNAFDISNFGIFVRIELNFTVFEKKKHKLMREPEICVLLSREDMFFCDLSDKYHLCLVDMYGCFLYSPQVY